MTSRRALEQESVGLPLTKNGLGAHHVSWPAMREKNEHHGDYVASKDQKHFDFYFTCDTWNSSARHDEKRKPSPVFVAQELRVLCAFCLIK